MFEGLKYADVTIIHELKYTLVFYKQFCIYPYCVIQLNQDCITIDNQC